MDKVAGLQVFIRVVESGSFSRAARELGLGQPAVSKHVAALERRLGTQLLHRTSRGLGVTPAGADFYSSVVRVLRDLDEAESKAGQGHGSLVGAVRVAVPPTMTGMMFVPRLEGFQRDFPDISVEFAVSDSYADLVREGLDLAIRIGELDSSGLLALGIGSMRMVTVASARYLERAGTPTTPGDLRDHQLLGSRFVGALSTWRFKDREAGELTPHHARFICNEPAAMHAAVVAGLGITQLSYGMFTEELRSGTVCEILRDYAPDPMPIHALYNGPRMPRRVRVVRDFLARCIGEQPGFELSPEPSGRAE